MIDDNARPAASAAAPVPSKTPRPKSARRSEPAPAVAAKPAAKPATKPAAKPSAKATAKPAEKPLAKAAGKAPRQAAPAPRAVLVRDSFTMPEADYALLAALKQRLLKAGHEAKKSELLRAALARLAALGDAELLAAARSVPRLATGRPKHKAKAKAKGKH